MAEGQPVRVESLAAYELHIRIVQIIADKGETEIFHMDTDLMGAARLQDKGEEAVPVFFF